MIPGVDATRVWADVPYRHVTDRQGFRTGDCPGSPQPAAVRRTVLVMGDSFTEGLGVDHHETFVGRLACAYGPSGVRIVNAGVTSHSPVIHLRKLRRLMDDGFKPDHVVVMLDVADIYDEAVSYEERDGEVVGRAGGPAQRLWAFAVKHLSSATLIDRAVETVLHTLGVRHRLADVFVPEHLDDGQALALGYGFIKSRWTVDPKLRRAFGDAGLALAARNLEEIVSLCRAAGCGVTLAVYPWPDQIVEGDRDSVQVTHWRAWAEGHGVGFVDLFPPFFEDAPVATIERYFFRRDSHWNAAGHRVIADGLETALGSVLRAE
jgi:lysophospholipase L1-like esterase